MRSPRVLRAGPRRYGDRMGPEWFVVIGVVVLLFGGSQLPKLARSLGQAKNEFEKGVSEGGKDAAPDAEPKSCSPRAPGGAFARTDPGVAGAGRGWGGAVVGGQPARAV